MFHEENEHITDAVERLMQVSSEYDRGQLIAWSEIEPISGNRNENRGKYIINKWRKRLENEREIVTLVANAVGVRLLTHRETATEIPRIRQKKAYRQIRRALKQTSLVDDAQLPLQERRLLASQRGNMAEQRRELFRSQRQARNGVVVTESNPRRVVA